MKRKHWQGYGTINAKVIKKTPIFREDGILQRSITIRVTGNHEYGLELMHYDPYTIAQWLGPVGKFKYEDVLQYIKTPEQDVLIDGLSVGQVDYAIWLKEAQQ